MLPSELEQGSPEWLQARCGKITASRINDVMAKLKGGGEAKSRSDYRMELVAERLTGIPEEQYVNRYMEWGTATEPLARAAYELKTDCVVDQVGFVVHPGLDFTGASPDGLVGSQGGIELKCPKTTTHLAWMQRDSVPPEHLNQCMWNMICTKREWWHFVSYDPRLPENLQLWVTRVNYDKIKHVELTKEVCKFDDEITAIVEELRGR